MLSVEEVRQRLDRVSFPGFRHSLIRYGLVQSVEIADGEVSIILLPASARREVTDEVRRNVTDAVRELPGVRSVRVGTAESPHAHPQTAEAGPRELPGIRRVLAVSSAKGGVGKSTVAVNLALALRERGARVALMDADVYGPSIPMMMGTEARPRPAGSKVAPIERYGVDLMSMGFFLDDKSPVIWRGPMVMGLIRQFLHDVEWGEQDYLVVDMPPGTGDAALTLAQQVPISGAVIVTTPQEVALQDVERGIAMFRQVQVPVLGIVENMSYYVCPECGEREEIFGAGGGESLARQFGIPVLGRLPIFPEIRESGDAGRPILVIDPHHTASREFRALAGSIDQALGARAAAPG
jgi:ATP-binding protein involved in chromosome partitioning